MSLRYEQYRSLHATRAFLYELMVSPRMSQKEVKSRARTLLKHYPYLEADGKPVFSNDSFPCPDLEKQKFF
jgi:hypothetical protein